MVITDAIAPENPIMFVNPAFKVLTGYTSDEAGGQNCRFLQAFDRQQPARYVLGEAVIAEGVRLHLTQLPQEGELFWNWLYLIPVESSCGRITNFVGIIEAT